MSDSRSRAADAEEELEAYLAEHPHPYPVGTEVMRVSPYTGSAVKVTRAATNRHSAGKYRHTVHLEGGALEWPVKDFERVQPDPGERARRLCDCRTNWSDCEYCEELRATQDPEQVYNEEMAAPLADEDRVRAGLEPADEDFDEEPGDLAETAQPLGEAVVQPDHYNRPGAPNCGDLIQALGLTYNVGTAQKYIYRAGIKTPNPLKDLRKAIQSLELEIAQLRPMWDDDE